MGIESVLRYKNIFASLIAVLAVPMVIPRILPVMSRIRRSALSSRTSPRRIARAVRSLFARRGSFPMPCYRVAIPAPTVLLRIYWYQWVRPVCARPIQPRPKRQEMPFSAMQGIFSTAP